MKEEEYSREQLLEFLFLSLHSFGFSSATRVKIMPLLQKKSGMYARKENPSVSQKKTYSPTMRRPR